MQDEEIKTVVTQTIESLPQRVKDELKDVEVIIEERAPIRMTIEAQYSHKPQPMRFIEFALPDKIKIYKIPLLRTAGTLEEARGHIKDALFKEISNYFGISEMELRSIKEQN